VVARTILTLVTLCLMPSAGGLRAQPITAESLREPLLMELATAFASRLESPEAYRQRVTKECQGFPEGDLFPYLFPLHGFIGMARDGYLKKATALAHSEALLRLAIPVVARRLKAPGGQLINLTGTRDQATYLCQLTAALGQYRLLGGREHHTLHDHLTALLRAALARSHGRPLRSFPSYSWPFDTIPCLASVALHDRATGQDTHVAPVQEFVDWETASGTDPGTGLPFSRVEDGTGCGEIAPRGCDLSLRIVFLSWFAPEWAARVYRLYADAMWHERLLVAGFAEWPDGVEQRSDIDSGPILWGLGSAATALGIGATRASGDTPRCHRLMAQTKVARETVALSVAQGPVTLAGAIPLRPGYVSGFLFGDAVLFFALAAPVGPPPPPRQD
jgi:hypothetical protein